MKRDSKSATIRKSGILFLLLSFLGGCADGVLPNWFTGEPDAAVIHAPRAVSRAPSAENRAWPNLADVPESKPSVLPLDKSRELTKRMAEDQQFAAKEGERIRQTVLDTAHLADDPVTSLEGEPYPVGILTAPDQPDPLPAKPFSALRP